MSIIKRLLGSLSPKKEKPTGKGSTPKSSVISVEQFISLNTEGRLRHIIFMDNRACDGHFAVIQQAILHDSDKNVRMAALKRIHFFKDNSETIPTLNKLKTEQNIAAYEPYFSMAALGLGLITEEEFNSIFK